MLETENKKYSALGIYKDDTQIQLNGNILQKESEFYSSIRLKQSIKNGETPLDALEKRGVSHVEVRILDLNPFERLGLSVEQMNFLQIFMLYCLFEKSKQITDNEYEKINSNHHHVALYGRKDGLKLQKYDNNSIELKKWGEEIFERLKDIAELIYNDTGEDKYVKCVSKEYEKLFDVSLLPSERIHREMKENNENFLEFGTRWAVNNLDKTSS
jgi:glutamate--cysteine ligase